MNHTIKIWKDGRDSSSDSDSITPESKCPICLGGVFEKSAPEKCSHFFCFQCILRWSKIKQECPLCKKPFKIVRKNFKSSNDYKAVPVIPSNPVSLVEHGPQSSATQNFNYFLNIFTHPSHIEDFFVGRRRNREDNILFRRSIYVRGLYVYRFSGAREPLRQSSPEYYREHPSQLERIRPWLIRELLAIGKMNGDRCAQQILNSLLEHDIDSSLFRRSIANLIDVPFQYHFIRELKAFATSVYDMFGFDNHACYRSLRFRLSQERPIEIDSDVEIIHDSNGFLPFVSTPAIDVSDSESIVDISDVTTRNHESESSEVIVISDEETQPSSNELNSHEAAVAGSSTSNRYTPYKRRRSLRSTETRPISSDDENSRHLRRKESKSKRSTETRITSDDTFTSDYENSRRIRRKESKSKRKSKFQKYSWPFPTRNAGPSKVLKMNPYYFINDMKDSRSKFKKERSRRVVASSSDDDEALANLVKPEQRRLVRCHKLLKRKVRHRAPAGRPNLSIDD